MSATRRKEMPPPDVSGTNMEKALSKRFSIGASSTEDSPIPDPSMGKGRYGSGMGEPKESKKRVTRDPDGMRRASYYISATAAESLDSAADRILAVLGKDMPRHVALSALIAAGANHLDEVVKQLAANRAAELGERLRQLEQTGS